MRQRKYTFKDIKAADNAVSSWFVLVIFRPLARCIIWLVSNFTSLSPNFITVLSLLFWIGAAFTFAQGIRLWTLTGGILCVIAYTLDCVDGNLARLKNQLTRLGYILDHICGVICFYGCISALVITYYRETENILALVLGFGFIAYHLSTIIYLEYLVPLISRKRRGTGTNEKYIPFKPHRSISIKGLGLTPSNSDGLVVLLVVGPISGFIYEGIVAAACIVVLEMIRYFVYEVLHKWREHKGSKDKVV